MNRPFIPRPHQQALIEFLAQPGLRKNVWAMMGMGKTSGTLFSLHVACALIGDDSPTLVLAPKRVAETVWPEETEKWDLFRHLEVTPIVGSRAAREKAVARDTPIHAINYENIPWLVERFGKAWPYRRVIADESTRLKSFRTGHGSGIRARALSMVAFKYVTEWINLTGTPAPNGLLDLWGQQWFIDRGARLGATFTAFKDRWFKADPYSYAITPLFGAQKEITDLLSDCTLSLRVEDWFNIDKPVVTTVPVKLPESARKLYRTVERQFMASIGNIHVEAATAMAKSAKCLQIASGTVIPTDEESGKASGKAVEVHSAKIDALESVLDELGGENVLVVYHWAGDLGRLRRAFPKAVALADHKDTRRVVADWNAGKIPLMFLHAQSAGHGLNLQDGGRAVVFYSYDWSLENHDQVLERIGPMRQMQSGHNRAVLVYYLAAEGTIDEAVLLRLRDKADVQTSLSSAIASANRRA